MILHFLLVLARKLWQNYLIWNNSTKRGGRCSSQKLLKKNQTNKTKTKTKTKSNKLFDNIDLLYSAKRKKIKGTESLEITCLGIHWIFKCHKKIWRCTWPKNHRKNTDKALAYSYSDIRSCERETKMSDVLHKHYTLLTLVPPGRGVGLDLPVPVRRVWPLLPIQQAPQQSSPLFPEVKINWLMLKDKKVQSFLWRT